ncbi:ATP-binding protein [Kocuria flava]|uniref:ATP-binding protein n=1 Tax=Kocuria flava TaxID=446860 RepID=UPI001FF61254|nr:ATP-binding protein [Kocuria flava]MCJ8505266.1 ATP-binding protein [Kocuria flava]
MGAAESNAGDDFHFWWAANRALALIAPDTNSQLLVVEGLSEVDDPDDQYETVDLSEYIGGDTFDTATTLVLSQLKYSTRYPTKVWTVARMCQKHTRRRRDGAAGTSRNLIGDLADAFKPLTAEHGRDAVMCKVRIQLISNQPGDPLLIDSLAAATEWVLAQDRLPRRADLLKVLPAEQSEVIKQLAEALGNKLTSGEFCDFLTVLDLTHTAALNRKALARSVHASASDLTAGRGTDSALRLFNLVRDEAMPDARRRGLRAADVLAALGVADVQDLYPAPPQLADISEFLPAPGASTVAEAVLAHPGQILVAHGAAGAGKTTALRQVGEHLPPGSAFLLFDCYGGGQYLSSGEERHTPQRFVMQIVNDLAQRCGTPLLLQLPLDEQDQWRHLSRTLHRAVETLPPDALLVLGVDAADNAAIAAVERGDRSFLPGLLGLSLSSQVVVVLTARTHRVGMIGATDSLKIPIESFDCSTSGKHLRRYRPQASDDQVAEFHKRTNGNPRTQFYALSQAVSDNWDVPALLGSCRRTPEPLFQDLLDSALKGSGATDDGQRWLAVMLALARPVNINILAIALEVDPASVRAFAAGLTPGVEMVGDTIQFRDEDFETFVREHVDQENVLEAHGLLADLFLAGRKEDVDAAAHVADHLFAAGRLTDLLELVLAEESPVGIADGFRRELVQERRLDLAAQAAASTNDAAAAVRVAARGCHTASRRDTLTQLVETRLDLVAQYADAELLRDYALRENREEWLGPILLRLAAVLARDSEKHREARATLESADAWLRRWMRGRENETRQWDLSSEDVAARAEALYRLDGADASIAGLRIWRPVDFILDSTAALAARLSGEIDPNTARGLLQGHRVPLVAQAPVLAYLAAPTTPPETEWVEEVAQALLNADLEQHNQVWQARFLDVVLRNGNRRTAGDLAQHWADELPPHRWAFENRASEGTQSLRVHAVAAALVGQALDVNTLVPDSLQGESQGAGHHSDPRANDRREWIKTVDPLAAISVLAARAAAGEKIHEAVVSHVENGLAQRLEKAGHRWFSLDNSYRAWAAIAAEAVVDANAPQTLLDQLAEAAPQLLKSDAPKLWLDLAESLALRGEAQEDRAIDLCLQTALHARTNTYAAMDRLEVLSRATEIVGAIEPEVGSRLFRQAVDAAAGISDDAARLLAVHADLAQRAEVAREERASRATQLVLATEHIATHATDAEIVPYQVIAGAVAQLDAAVGLATASRWDDEARVPLAETLSAALIGAVDGGGVSSLDAVFMDHLVEDDRVRLEYQFHLVRKLASDPTSTPHARLALLRAVKWLRHHVPAISQPAMARRLLTAAQTLRLESTVETELAPLCALEQAKPDGSSTTRKTRHWMDNESSQQIQALLEKPELRNWQTLADNVTALDKGYVSREQLRVFVSTVAFATHRRERLDALAAIAELPGRYGAEVACPVLAACITRWREWPGVTEWAADALPAYLARHLIALSWHNDMQGLTEHLRALADDDTIRRAVLEALPKARAQLTAFGWQNITALLGHLCPAHHADTALVGLLTDHRPDDDGPATNKPNTEGVLGPLPMFLWSAFGHPRRAVRWRAAHVARELLTQSDIARASTHATALLRCLELSGPGSYRDPKLYFYQFSAVVTLLTTLARVASDKPELLVPHFDTLLSWATNKDFPHAQIRELAHATASVIARHQGTAPEELTYVNRPTVCAMDRQAHHFDNDRRVSQDRRYDFDWMNTIPYWFAPLARVFDVPVDEVAERAERWILDRWGLNEDDWMADVRELRDEGSWDKFNNDHGSIPSEESLSRYMDYHAMMMVAGELIDEERSVRIPDWDDAGNPWQEWLKQFLPWRYDLWVSDLRQPVPVEPDLFAHLHSVDVWGDPDQDDYDRAIGLTDSTLPEKVLVAGSTNITRSEAYGNVYICSALVTRKYSAALQRALAAASDPRDWKLPEEDEKEFEIDHGFFILRGWLTRDHDVRQTLDEHDPYAHDIRGQLPLPGLRFRQAAEATLEPTGLALRSADRTTIAGAEQWADPKTNYKDAVTNSGYRVWVDQKSLLDYLKTTHMNLIVEVQIGRHRRNSDEDGYQPDHSRIYIIDDTGNVTAR